jgi:aspartyl-tRNA(Asn)/glutamyl-tRNA(Gln) amidotransferase subunit A
VLDAFGAYDAVVSPTLPTVTYPIGKPFDQTYTQYSGTPELISPGNLAGWPALAMPNGFGDHGLPTGVSLLGTPFNETRLTAVGKRYQQLTAFHQRRPPLVTNHPA